MVDELRRSYHDRIAHVRANATEIVRVAADASGNVTRALLADDVAASGAIVATVGAAESKVAEVERDVIDLLAQQAPVARDLRILLASLRVSQIGDLCLGLVGAIAARVGRSQELFTSDMRDRFHEVGHCTASVLGHAADAWTALDAELATAVVAEGDECRDAHRRFLAVLVGKRHMPVDIGVDLGMVARAYERLTDHAIEIAGRVEVAATGVALASADRE